MRRCTFHTAGMPSFTTVCVRGGGGYDSAPLVEVLRWDSASEAREALSVLIGGRCSRRCRGTHLAVVQCGERWEVTAPPQPGPPPLAEELESLYKREILAGVVERWPKPTILNMPLSNPLPRSDIRERIRN